MKTMSSNTIGAITEMKCQLYFMQLGYIISVPTTPERYDFILDTGKQLYKIQVKTSREVEGGFTFQTCSCHFINGKATRSDYKNDNIDFFCTEFDGIYYLIPISESGTCDKKLRTQPTKNNQTKGVSFAQDYVATKILDEYI